MSVQVGSNKFWSESIQQVRLRCQKIDLADERETQEPKDTQSDPFECAGLVSPI